MYSDKTNVLQVVSLLQAHNIKDVVLCPGSRDIPLVHSFCHCQFFRTYNLTDERSAAFFANGIALERKAPVALILTSGSAVLNAHPAVSEAFYQQIPLLVISSDRPAAWIGQRDGQTLPQPHVFNTLVKKSVSLVEVNCEQDAWYNNRLINEAILELNHHVLGPVHINVPISEPFFNFTTKDLPTERVINRLCLPSWGQSYSFALLHNPATTTAEDSAQIGLSIPAQESLSTLSAPQDADNTSAQINAAASDLAATAASDAAAAAVSASAAAASAAAAATVSGTQTSKLDKDEQRYKAVLQVLDQVGPRFVHLLVNKPRRMLIIGQDQWRLLSRFISPEIWMQLSSQMVIVTENLANLHFDHLFDGVERKFYQMGTIDHIDAILHAQQLQPYVGVDRKEYKQHLAKIDFNEMVSMLPAFDHLHFDFDFDFAEQLRSIVLHSLATKSAELERNPQAKEEVETSGLTYTDYLLNQDADMPYVGGLERPDVVITIGGHIISKRLKKFLRAQKVEHIHVSADGEVADLFGTLSTVVEMDPVSFVKLLHASLALLDHMTVREQVGFVFPEPLERLKLKGVCAIEPEQLTAPAGGVTGEHGSFCYFDWGKKRREEQEVTNRFVAAARLAVLSNEAQRQAYPVSKWGYSQMRAIVELLSHVPADSVVHLANSSSVRYAQMAERLDVTYQANRGVNGIEGSLSTAMAYASVSERLNFIVIGDLSFFYDMNALWQISAQPNVRIMVLNNSGGEIFHALPGLHLDGKSLAAVTGEHRTSVKAWVQNRGCTYFAVHKQSELQEVWDRFCSPKVTGCRARPLVLEVFTDAASDMAILKELQAHGYV